MNRKKRLVGLSVLVFALIVGLAYAVPYGVRTLYQRWDRINSEDTKIQLVDMYCNFTDEFTFTYQLTFNNTDGSEHSAIIEFVIYNSSNIEIYRNLDGIVNLGGNTMITIEFDVPLLTQDDINEHDHFKIGITEGLE